MGVKGGFRGWGRGTGVASLKLICQVREPSLMGMAGPLLEAPRHPQHSLCLFLRSPRPQEAFQIGGSEADTRVWEPEDRPSKLHLHQQRACSHRDLGGKG